MPNPIDAARSLIQSRLADLDAEAKNLERALVGLGERSPERRGRSGRPPKGPAAGAPSPSQPKRRGPRKRKGAKRAARGERQTQLLAAIKANPGARPSELAKEMGVRPTQVSVLLAKARGEKLIVKKGEGYALRG